VKKENESERKKENKNGRKKNTLEDQVVQA